MASLLNGFGGMVDGLEDPRLGLDSDISPVCFFCFVPYYTSSNDFFQALEIYGPLGTRAYVRNALAYTHTKLGAAYVVHELRFPSDPPEGDLTSLPPRITEYAGRNIPQEDGIWKDIYKDNIISVSAAPIHHSVPCVGYVVVEAPVAGKVDPSKYLPELKRTKTPLSVMHQLQQGASVVLNDGTILHGPPRRPGRKIVILGDTYDPSPIAGLAEGANVLIHEATNAFLPYLDETTKVADTEESVEARTKSRGHSTPQMAGAFAKRVAARQLILNHFSARYRGDESEESLKIMQAIADLAAGELGRKVTCARDFMTVNVDFN